MAALDDLNAAAARLIAASDGLIAQHPDDDASLEATAAALNAAADRADAVNPPAPAA